MNPVRPARPVLATLVAAMLVGLAGCTAIPAAPTSTPTPTAGAGFVLDEDFPDPDVVATDDGYAAFATGTFGINIQSAASPDLVTWQISRDDALPTMPAWATTGKVWAPDVAPRPDGVYVMYFTAEDIASGRQCIGTATSPDPAEPFVGASDEPLVCPVEEGGAIDASTFTDDDGTRYLLWKTDGNCCGQDTWIRIAPLSEDGLSLVGEPTDLIKQSLEWEGNLVEAPVLVRHDDRYVLLYSANDYGGDDYATGFATAADVLGPYDKNPDPLLSTANSDGRYRGPGGEDVVSTPAGDVLVFHSWDDAYVYRGLNAAPLEWDADRPTVVLPD
ncbi:glycoside hydrolase family 43 protein [Microbacterium terricola]|uniref:Glycoside hydrolase n=1 Tax=Microbacterium terricola TaxID=344163 RepID=A0ABM8E1U2_9MICO|nr:glycoside hydrolase family 43 protein [Microbacterium terricola]UYK40379.1 glycoside hydrolase family 43 protein [Microbacterium terricola]BDV31903.1 glycoside hydrolase [Microbacterium terricola]